jgi:hypothetical protein
MRRRWAEGGANLVVPSLDDVSLDALSESRQESVGVR